MGHYPANNLICRSPILSSRKTHSRSHPLSSFSLSFPRLCRALGQVSYVLLSSPPLVLLQETCMSKCKPDSRNLQQDKLEFNSQLIAEMIVIHYCFCECKARSPYLTIMLKYYDNNTTLQLIKYFIIFSQPYKLAISFRHLNQ